MIESGQAETCEQYLHKGSPVFVEGELEFDEKGSKEEVLQKIRSMYA